MERVLYGDVLPYATPTSLHELHGPDAGVLTLPLHLFWSGLSPDFDLADTDDLVSAYSAVVREGSAEDQARYLDRDLLARAWASLRLPVRCRSLWEERFPELRALARA